MPRYISKITFREADETEVVAIAAVFGQPDKIHHYLTSFLAMHECILVEAPKFEEVIEIARRGALTPVIGKISRDVGPHLSVSLHIVNRSVSMLGEQSPDPDDPVFIIFNTAENWELYQRLRAGDQLIFDVTSLTDGARSLNSPATVGVYFPGWTSEAMAIVEETKTSLIISRPPASLTKNGNAAQFRLMCDPALSINHALDPVSYASEPEIEMDEAHDGKPILFRKSACDKKAVRFIGFARFEFQFLEYFDTSKKEADPKCARVLEVACDTALADTYSEGQNYGSMPKQIRRGAGIPDVSAYQRYEEFRKKVLPFLIKSTNHYLNRNDNKVMYPQIQTLAECFALANERGQLEESSSRWQALCEFDIPKSIPLEFNQVLEIFHMETCK